MHIFSLEQLTLTDGIYFPGDVRKPLRQHAYSNILKILPPKTENFQIKNSEIFHHSAQNIDLGGSNEYPQSMFLSRNKKKMYTPVNPSFTI